MLRKRGIHFYLVLGLFSVYLINGLIAIPRNSVTYDEMDNWSYGKRILMRKTDKIYPFDDASSMPITGLNAIPRAVQQLAKPGLLKTDGGFSDIMHGRYVTLIICLLTGLFIYVWAKKLFGENGGLLSLFLFVFCPNLNGHGILLTTDAYAALFTVTTAYFYWRFIKQSGWKNFLAFSISMSFAQITDYSMLHLVILFGLISFFVLLKRKTILKNIIPNLIRLIVLGVVVLVIINLAFLFNDPGMALYKFSFSSHTLTGLQNSFLGSIPLPLPEPYISGLDLTMYMNELGGGHPDVSYASYILGEKRIGTGFWYYYLVLFLFKTPLTGLLAIIAAIIFLLVRKRNQGHPSTMLFLIGLIFYFLLVFGWQSNMQIGIRHVLIVYPLLYVLGGFMATLPLFQRRVKLFSGLVAVYSMITYYYFFPNLISYSNEFIPIKKNAYKVMADSNLDFGQGWYSLEKYLKSHPDVHIIGDKPMPGKFVIGVSDYLDLKNDHKYYWIYGLKPSKQINHCFLLFEVMP